MKKASCAAALALALSGLVSGVARAGIVSFDPDGPAVGNGTYQVGSFDLLPGNSLAKNALPIPGIAGPPGLVQLYQSRLGALLDAHGNVISVPGLNSTFEITLLVAYPATSVVTGSTVSTQFNPTGGPSYVEMFYDTAHNANDLAGTGFNDGTMIYKGTVTSANGVISFGATPTLLDQFNNDDWGGQVTLPAIGGLSLAASTNSLMSAWFPQGSAVTAISANTSTALPYQENDPSHQFIGTDGVTPVTPSIGALNGASGPDILIQADANAEFTVVPEPATLGLLGLSGLMLLRRRSQTA